MTSWTFSAEAVDTADAETLRRDYYAEVAERYWKRPVTAAEVDAGLAGDGAARLTPPTGRFVVGRWAGTAAACGGIRMLDAGRAELTRVYLRPAFRGRGGAGLLLAELERQAAGLGAREIVLNTRFDLVEARALYARNGYAEIPPYGTDPYAQIWFGKSLAFSGR